MTGLLVSVRDAAEARIALAGGADLIDVKEPRLGSLGTAEPAVWHDVQKAVAGRVPLSAALGELVESSSEEMAIRTAQLGGIGFAKIGLSGYKSRADWEAPWRRAMSYLPCGTEPVAVVYADWQSADAPPPDVMIEAAARLNCAAVLWDTYDKRGGSLLSHVDVVALQESLKVIHDGGMKSVLAGSLTRDLAERLLPLAPTYLAVRGAVCRNGRTGTIAARLVAEFAEIVRSSPHAPFLSAKRAGKIPAA